MESVEVVIAGYQKKEPYSFNERKTDRFVSRGRTCACSSATDKFRTSAEDYYYPAYIRCAWLHNAG